MKFPFRAIALALNGNVNPGGKKKAHLWSQSAGLQLPGEEAIKRLPGDTVVDEGDEVKRFRKILHPLEKFQKKVRLTDKEIKELSGYDKEWFTGAELHYFILSPKSFKEVFSGSGDGIPAIPANGAGSERVRGLATKGNRQRNQSALSPSQEEVKFSLTPRQKSYYDFKKQRKAALNPVWTFIVEHGGLDLSEVPEGEWQFHFKVEWGNCKIHFAVAQVRPSMPIFPKKSA